MSADFFDIRMHSIGYIGCMFVCITTQVISDNTFKRSVIIEDDGFELVKNLPNGREEVWDIIPNQELQIPDDVDFFFDNHDEDESLIVDKIGKGKTVSIELGSGESAQIIESETGGTGLLQTHIDQSQSLHAIGGSVDFTEKCSAKKEPIVKQLEQLGSSNDRDSWASVTDAVDRPVTVFSPSCNTVKLPSKKNYNNQSDHCDYYEKALEIPTRTLTNTTSWWPSHTTLLGYGCLMLLIYGGYYLADQAKQCARYLYREDLWSVWKSDEEPYEVLLHIKPEYLANDLIEAIRVKYYGEEDPVKLFFEDIEQEYDLILQWIQFRNNVTAFYLPVGPDFYTMEERIRFLELMRKSVNYWRAQQVLGQKK